MSANEYVVCPRCVKEVTAEREKAIAKAQAQYGKVSAEEYRRLIGVAEAMPDKPKHPTLAEYYEFSIDAEEFSVNFRAHCTACGFTHEYEAITAVEV